MKLLIIGGGAAGSTAAQFARKTNRQAEITVLGNESYSEYAKCGLPYAVSGIIPSFDELTEFSMSWFQRFKINLKLQSEVYDIQPEAKVVKSISLKDGSREEYQYDVLIIATGSSSWVPPIKGAFLDERRLKEGVFTLRTMDDAKKIHERVKKGNTAMVVGSGLIGMEMAEAFSLKGMETYVRLRTHLLTGMIDEDMAAIVQRNAGEQGIHFIPRTTVAEIGGENEVKYVILRNLDMEEEYKYPADLVIIAAGSKATVEIARKAGCQVGSAGGIVVDEKCKTSIKDIYAAGDCTEYPEFVTGEPGLIGLGSIGVKQGRVAGVNAAGGEEEMASGVLNTRTTELFGLEISAVGPTMRDLRKAGIEPIVGKMNGVTLPNYFPGKKAITVKVMAHPNDGKILAAQIIGEEDVHQRINVFAIAILEKMTLADFMQLETCYAPPAAPTLDCMTLAVDAALLRWKRRRDIVST
ncbi:MAG: FAD-dependent oxidoreductase [Deltaproteobacteria bacterium]|nr:FAD-dependent oxidoreductase [Deltaproteobacteria bacterium]MCD6295599.1 FAD-dependent oxidoreductase [Deltaproteobacteria bacterium]